MSTRHHPADALLAQYAGGTLKPGFDLVIGAHLETCARCRKAVSLFEATGGELIRDLPPAPMAADALPRLLARLDAFPGEPSAPPQPALPRERRPLAERLPLRQRRWVGPGVWVQPVDVETEAGDRVYLLRVPGGMKGLHHCHKGPEFTVVLSGALRDGGHIYRAGDFAECGSDLTHQPQAEMDDGGCICLVAAEGGIKAKDWIGRVVAAMTGV